MQPVSSSRYYNYTYIAVDKNNPGQRRDLEGDYWETENSYTILMYYRSFTDRADQLIGYLRSIPVQTSWESVLDP